MKKLQMERTSEDRRERIDCPLCGGANSSVWATENGFSAVKCGGCGLIYVNPRPSLATISEAIRTGVHTEDALDLNVVGRRVPGKVGHYKKIIAELFGDSLHAGRPLSWLDVGAGFGEVVEAVTAIAPTGSVVEGVEPMKAKADWARSKGLSIKEGYLSDVDKKFDVVSIINIFSHIPDFAVFLNEIKRVLHPNGQILIETGNAGDIGERKNFPGELTLPDHLVFAGEAHIRRYLTDGGFELLETKRIRIDDLDRFARNIVKVLLGRPVALSLPYTSPTRTVLFRARLLS